MHYADRRRGRLYRPPPSPAAFTPAERRLIRRLRTPVLVQRFLNRLPYNTETPPDPETLRSLREVLRHRTAHCLEAALAAACILEQHGYPPLVMSLMSIDYLDHVIFVYRRRGRWGSVARSRDPGLHGRKPVFRSLRALAMSYFDPYIDFTGCITGYGLFDLRRLGAYDWRLARKNMWAVERALLRFRHKPLQGGRERIRRYRAHYRAYRAKYDKKPLFYRGREKWTEIPKEFL
ncbi:MAG: hypothetical protein E6G74_09645 [Alphaproteobacteria bacterium]|nr:MAG: hypothetical protein E6G78_01575 [Alphaproteobacteria bacterium]TMK01719.1 MAG: hypothetical protein E6G74_09645 [Alphaproteobacteria bacterium]TMK04133.1 MAG: hypothetical protein E6G77_02645 [Alphaproteobacteria bacterium]